MKEKVLITITGSHETDGETESIETIQPGNYKFLQGKHFVQYEEVLEESLSGKPVCAKCLLKISSDSVTLSKKGPTRTEMYFKAGEDYTTLYDTPFGSLQMKLYTTTLNIQETEDSLNITIDYSMDMNYSHVSDCNIKIKITS